MLRKITITSVKTLSTLRVVSETRMEQLATFVKKVRKEKGLSTTDVEVRSGKSITDGYISQIENLYIKNVSPEKLSALAKGLGVSEEEVFAIARGKNPNKNTVIDERFERLSLGFRRLKGERRRDAEAYLKALERAIEDLDQ